MSIKQLGLKLALSDSDLRILDKAKKDGKINKVVARVEATHSGIINKNKWFYIPSGMEDGVGTFTAPFNKPVLLNHDAYSDPVGRVIDSEYVEYDIYKETKFTKSTDAVGMMSTVKDFITSDAFMAEGYRGLGHVMLTVEVTDAAAIEKLLDGRYLTVSISGDTAQAVCSICGTDKKEDDKKDYEDRTCNHWRGNMYDGEEAFLVAGAMSFSEVSFVNKPADENAKVSEVLDGVSDSLQCYVRATGIEIIDFEVEQEEGIELSKIKLSDLLKSENIQEQLDEQLVEVGLGDHVADQEALDKLRKTSFVMSDTRAMPIYTGPQTIAALKLLETVEDSSDKTALLSIVNSKFRKIFKDKTLDTAIESLEPAAMQDSDRTAPEKVEAIDLDALTDSIVAKLGKKFQVDDSFLGKRNEVLEDEVVQLEKENAALLVRVKDAMISQIMQVEDNLTDENKRKLSLRSIESLSDKLADLLVSKTDATVDANEDNVDNGIQDNADDISDADVSISDATEDGIQEDDVTDGSAAESDDASGDDTDKLSVQNIKDEYRKLIKDEGFRAASKYLNGLRDSGEVPAHFTFN